jgi:hypothetical protein
MKKIKNLTVQVTYRVSLHGLSVSDQIYNQLNKIVENGGETSVYDYKNGHAVDWLSDTIKERDCIDHSFEIEELS